MRRRVTGWLAACVLVLGLPSAAWAQVQLKAKMEHGNLLPYEPAYLLLTFINTGGTPVTLREQDSAFRFKLEVLREDGTKVPSRGIPIIHDALLLDANSTREFRLNLLKVFELHERGGYTVNAMVIEKRKVGVFTKNYFDIVSGVEINRFISPRPVRVFILHTLNRMQSDRLLVHIEDENARTVFGVYDLGSWMRGYPPEGRVDEDGNLHLLHRRTPTQYTHSIFTSAGSPLKHEYYRINGGQAHLKPTPDGGMEVVGAELIRPDPEAATPAGESPVPAN